MHPATVCPRAIVIYILSIQVQTKILLSGDNTEGVGMAHSSSPALHTDDWGTLFEDAELDCIHDAPLQTAVNILLPWRSVKVGLCFGEVEWVDTAVKVGVL